MFDVMVKRLHEYKRQTLKLLHIVTLYQRICRRTRTCDVVPAGVRLRRQGGARATGWPSRSSRLINAVGRVRRQRPAGRGPAARSRSRPNYNVTLAETLIPAADLSEQISLAGKEASGTGNMKLALNGALTIGT